MTAGAMIYFVRHGESEANVRGVFANRFDDHALTERGRQQTLALAAKLRSCGIGRIYTSPVRRARESALLLTAALEIAAEISEGLREYDVGSLEGTSEESGWRAYDAVLEAVSEVVGPMAPSVRRASHRPSERSARPLPSWRSSSLDLRSCWSSRASTRPALGGAPASRRKQHSP